MSVAMNMGSGIRSFGIRVGRRRGGYQSIKTVEEFSKLLDKLRPKIPEVEISRIDYEDDVVLKVYVEGRYVRAVKVPKNAGEKQVEKRIDALMEKHTKAPLMWPGCRKSVARHLGCEVDRDFNVWFDDMASRLSETDK